MNIDEILKAGVAAKASDIHINVGQPPLFRVHTIVKKSEFPAISSADALPLLKQMADEKRLAELEKRRDSDFSYEIAGGSIPRERLIISETPSRWRFVPSMTRSRRLKSC